MSVKSRSADFARPLLWHTGHCIDQCRSAARIEHKDEEVTLKIKLEVYPKPTVGLHVRYVPRTGARAHPPDQRKHTPPRPRTIPRWGTQTRPNLGKPDPPPADPTAGPTQDQIHTLGNHPRTPPEDAGDPPQPQLGHSPPRREATAQSAQSARPTHPHQRTQPPAAHTHPTGVGHTQPRHL